MTLSSDVFVAPRLSLFADRTFIMVVYNTITRFCSGICGNVTVTICVCGMIYIF